jgi:hypothetical protein
MNDILFKKIKRANSKYAEYLSACDKVAKAAQKHINWNDSVGCAYMPGDGLCIEIEAHVCPATRFFELPDISAKIFEIEQLQTGYLVSFR